MFAPNDISIQQINKVDAPAEKEWVMLIKLDWANKKGYLASQLQDGKDDNKCRKLNYLPHTEIGIHVFKDQAKCCEDSKNYWDCKKKGCSMVDWMVQMMIGRMVDWMVQMMAGWTVWMMADWLVQMICVICQCEKLSEKLSGKLGEKLSEKLSRKLQ